MRALQVFFVAVIIGVVCLACKASAFPVGVPDDPPSAAEGTAYFEKHIRPLFSSQCQSCHGPNKQKGDLRLDQPEFIRKGGDLGPIIQAGKPKESLILKALSYEDDELKMPPRGKLSAEQIDHVRRWIELGAPMPKELASGESASPSPSSAFDLQARVKHWCYQPIRHHTIPTVQDKSWPIASLDSFIKAKLESVGLRPALDVEKTVWLRRVTFDLIGLPPTPEEIAAFENDQSSEAYAKVVDRLLASPRYGECWARHWLDLIRYADTLGHEFDFDLPNAWRYRNYIIRALNDDVPYHQLVLEHFAGDLLMAPRINGKEQWNESIQGTAFLWLGEAKQAPVDVRQEQADRIDNQIDIIGKTFLGQTLACARCHDHKFDAIATKDYYSLYGVLKSSRYQQACIDLPARSQQVISRLEQARDELRQLLLKEWRKEAASLADEKWKKALANRDIVDFGLAKTDGWKVIDLNQASVQGLAWAKCTTFPDLAFDFSGKQPSVRLVPAFSRDSALLTRQAEGALRTDTFPIEHRYLHANAAGIGGRIKIVIDGFQIIREPIYGGLRKIIHDAKPRWYTFDLAMWKGRQAYVEGLDGGPNDLGVEDHPKEGATSWLQVNQILLSDTASVAVAQNGKDEFNDEVKLQQNLLEFIDNCLEKRPPKTDLVSLCCLLVKEGILPSSSSGAAWDDAVKRYQQAEKQLPEPRYCLATADGNGDDEAVFTRGNCHQPGLRVQRGLSAIYCGAESLQVGSGSGRLALAQRLVDPQRNPLIARVIANRIWKHHFGEGLVKSVDDFGRMGELPSHPELLDFLAARFVQDGWSIKKLQRQLVLSRTYRQSSKNDDPQVARLDPQGRLLSRMSLRRLEAETIRDAVLAASGQLKLEPREVGVLPCLTPLMQGRGRPTVSGPLDGGGYRSIYLSVRRNFLPALLTSFDFPTPFSTMGRRSVSNVPGQELALMNDPFVIEEAQRWAEKVLREEKTPAACLERMFITAFARKPSSDEKTMALCFLKEQIEDNHLQKSQAWKNLAHALICAKEFIFIP
jgi:mono/diheme cytochrome c family protein